MDEELAKELREATNELLVPGTNSSPSRPAFLNPSPDTSSAHPAHRKSQLPTNPIPLPRSPIFSPDAKLELIPSPTEIRPPQWPVPQSPLPSHSDTASSTPGAQPAIKLELGDSLLTNADDDNLPARGLSSFMGSVRDPHNLIAASPPPASETESHPSSSSAADPSSPSRSPKAAKSRIRTPVNDIYINQYGERVLNGKVIGRTLGGRPRSGLTVDSLPSRSSSPFAPELLESRATPTVKSPPAFFLESFPNALSPTKQFLPLPPILTPSEEIQPTTVTEIQAPKPVARPLVLAQTDDLDDVDDVDDVADEPSFLTADADQSRSGPSSPDHIGIASALQRLSLQARPGSAGTLRRQLELPLLRRPTPTTEVTSAETGHVVLHGNKRQARASGAFEPPSSAQTSPEQENRASSPFLLPVLSKRVEKLFTTPLIPPKSTAENVDPHRPQEEDEWSSSTEDHIGFDVMASVSAPSSPTLGSPSGCKAVDESEGISALENGGDVDADDKASLESAPSSLLSLPVSTLTGSSHAPSQSSGAGSLERRRSSSSRSRRRAGADRPRRSDLSYPDDNFARDVRIRGWNEVGGQARGWVVFEIRIVTKQGTTITAFKRFSSFVALRQRLKSECPDQAKWLPALPSKSTGLLRKYDAKHLENRRKNLQRWLEVVMLDKVWGCSECLRDWVLGAE
ncbi:hypothetical protein BCV70DRAFT_199510 [Testicularia cyperi]|uniref:Endosomal/vacuolar adapter protein YPT35 n=1 Tax=Testicularia cyperi TaxID=1882483 RepID=A0A317XS10_9BASI|nr:hypothetical protein BCV70DRAFT_199510 [Testicularia cyperi]